MREKSIETECQAAQPAGHVRLVAAEMCSRDPPTLLSSTLAKANGTKPVTANNQQQQAAAATTVTHHNNAVEPLSNGLPGGTPGGRLKFFKDGKFILELSHRRDGERTTWFPVPKKTFWPPASTTPNRQESSASLSSKTFINFNF